jgi:hypothetical protein
LLAPPACKDVPTVSHGDDRWEGEAMKEKGRAIFCRPIQTKYMDNTYTSGIFQTK